MSRAVDWGNSHLHDQYGPVGKKALRRFFQQDLASWNRVRRAHLQNAPAVPGQVFQANAQAAVNAQALLGVRAVQAVNAQALLGVRVQAVNAQAEAVQEHICSICMEPLGSAVIELECGHSYHGVCVAHWFRRNPACPLCRALPRR